jgi:sialic acid synthase SpsE
MLINIDGYMVKEHPVYNLLKNWIIPSKDWVEILVEAKKKKFDTIILSDDIASVNFCFKNNELVDAIEVHAACINDVDLLDRAIDFAIKYKKTLIIGISGFEIQELLDIIEYIKAKGYIDLLLMYGFQNYPTNISQINLDKVKVLEKILNCKIGYADHTEFSNNTKEILINTAFSMGINVHEIHYVLEEGVDRTDYITGVGNDRLKKIKSTLIDILVAKGTSDLRLNEGERKYLNYRKIPIYKKGFTKGDVYDKSMITFKRIEIPTEQHKFLELDKCIEKKLIRNVSDGEEVFASDFGELND